MRAAALSALLLVVASAAAQTEAPQPTKPAEGAVLDGFVAYLDWTRSAGATGFDVQVSLSSTFEVLLYDEHIGGAGRPYIFLGADGLFYWRVRVHHGDTVSTWSPVATFRTPILTPPVPRAPENGAVLPPGGLDLVWNNAEYGLGMDVGWQLATDDSFTQVVDSGSTDDRVAPVTVAVGQVYYWRVRYELGDAERKPLPWSEAFRFSAGADSLVNRQQIVADFLTVANAAGPLDPPEYAALANEGNGFPHPTTTGVPNGGRQQATSSLRSGQGWAIFTFGERRTYDEWFQRVTYDGLLIPALLGSDYEWRFTGSSLAWKQYEDSSLVTVPYELWDIGKTSNDVRDDVRLIPILCETPCTGVGADGVFDLAGDSPLADGEDDPLTDAVYWFRPADTTSGQAGYQAYVQAATMAVPSFDAVGEQIWARFSLVGLNFGTATPYPQALPEAGTVFRIVTGNPQVDAPVLTGPPNGGTIKSDDVLTWIVPVGITSVQVQIATAPDFDPAVINEDLSVNVNARVIREYPIPSSGPGLYYWRVRTRGLIGSPWSEVRSYRITDPTATAPGETLPVPQEITVTAFPNPFAGRATLRIGLDALRPVRLVLYDVMGRQVAVLKDGRLPAGWHEVAFDGTAIVPGVYLYRLTTDGAVRTGSVVLLR